MRKAVSFSMAIPKRVVLRGFTELHYVMSVDLIVSCSHPTEFEKFLC